MTIAFDNPARRAFVVEMVSEDEVPNAVSLNSALMTSSRIVGPALAGLLITTVGYGWCFLVDAISWRAVFFINVPLVLLGLYATLRHVAESRDEEATGQFDWVGAAVVFLAVGGLSFGAIVGQQVNWHGAVPYLSLGIGAVAAVAGALSC